MGTLQPEQLKILLDLISKASFAENSEFAKVLSTTDGVYEGYIGKQIKPLSLDNTELVEVLCNLVDEKPKNMSTLHLVDYYKGYSVVPHKDASTLTLVIITEDNFEGGEFYLNNKIVSQFRKKGQYLTYNGESTLHEIKEITEGHRQTIACWFYKDKAII